jgi:hypothetical protein
MLPLRNACLTRRLCSLCVQRLPARRLYSAQPALAHDAVDLHDSSGTHEPVVELDTLDTAPPATQSPVFKGTETEPKRRLNKKEIPSEADGTAGQKARKPKKERRPKEPKPPKEPRPNPLENLSFNLHLADIQAKGIAPTLQDVEQFRPDRPHEGEEDSEEYVAAHGKLVETLCRAFSRKQLENFARAYKLDNWLYGKDKKKDEIAAGIIEKAWGWRSATMVKERMADRNIDASHGTMTVCNSSEAS